jgi:eukaryotic-like serine/threonine-protein kinase
MLRNVRGPSPLESPEALVGHVLLERYRVDEIAGRGGMSVVYRGTDERLKRTVAIKVFSELFGGNASKVSYQHFVQEAFALSRLNHPHTIRIYDFACVDEGQHQIAFQVSEFMDGGTLTDFIRRRGAQPATRALHLLECLGGAVSEAHSMGIVHRDVKPSNVLFGRAGRQRIVKLADFSVAQACLSACEAASRVLGDQTLVSNVRFWSLGWSAPEQVRGDDIGVAADIYGLGLVLAFVLAGERVLVHEHPSDFFQAPAKLDAAVERALAKACLPDPLAEVCLRACRAMPNERFANVDAFVSALRHAVQGPKSPKTAKVLPPPKSDSSPWLEATPAVPPPQPLKRPVTISDLSNDIVLAAGRRVRILELVGPTDIELAGPTAAPTRLRITVLPHGPTGGRVHVRGLNCFVARPNGVPTSGLELSSDGPLAFFGPDRSVLGIVQTRLATHTQDTLAFDLTDAPIAISASAASDALLFDSGPEAEVVLLYAR